MHPMTSNQIVNDRITSLYRDAAIERLAALARQQPAMHHRAPERPAGLRGWLRIVLRGAA